MEDSKKYYTKEEIAPHNVEGDCWVIVDGKVYDASKYMADHPGGMEIMLENSGGVDATEDYENADHTKRAR